MDRVSTPLFCDSYLRSVLVFPTGQDSATFRNKGTEVPSLSRDKLKILPRDGTGRDSQNPEQDAGQNGTEQKRATFSFCVLLR